MDELQVCAPAILFFYYAQKFLAKRQSVGGSEESGNRVVSKFVQRLKVDENEPIVFVLATDSLNYLDVAYVALSKKILHLCVLRFFRSSLLKAYLLIMQRAASRTLHWSPKVQKKQKDS